MLHHSYVIGATMVPIIWYDIRGVPGDTGMATAWSLTLPLSYLRAFQVM